MKECHDCAKEIERNHGIAFCGINDSNRIMLLYGIEKIEELEGAKSKIEYYDFIERVDKVVSVEFAKFFQIGKIRGTPEFEKAKEVEE